MSTASLWTVYSLVFLDFLGFGICLPILPFLLPSAAANGVLIAAFSIAQANLAKLSERSSSALNLTTFSLDILRLKRHQHLVNGRQHLVKIERHLAVLGETLPAILREKKEVK